MPVNFLTTEQRESYGCYVGIPSPEELARCFYLDEIDLAYITKKRGNHNKLGFALQLSTVRYLGTFLENLNNVPQAVGDTLAKQLKITDFVLSDYSKSEWRWVHMAEIRAEYGYCEFVHPLAGFRLTRWLYMLCWTGTKRPSILFERARIWLLSHKVLLPGVSVLERFISKLRNRVEVRTCRLLVKGLTTEQKKQLETLLKIPSGGRYSLLDFLRKGPVRISAPALVAAIARLLEIRNFGVTLPETMPLSQSCIKAIARFATTAKVSAINRLSSMRRLATLVAFVHCLKSSAHDDALDVFDMLVGDLFKDAVKEDKKRRIRTLKDLDNAAIHLADASEIILDVELSDNEIRSKIFAKVPREILADALTEIRNLVSPPDNVYFQELNTHYRSVRRFFPLLLKYIKFESNSSGKNIVAALELRILTKPITDSDLKRSRILI